jgi:hypothetical protein
MSGQTKTKAGIGFGGILWRAALRMVLALAIVAGSMLICAWWSKPPVRPAGEIFRGVVYECREMNSADGSGKAHLIRIDLKEPGVELYLTPEDAGAKSSGNEYVTRWGPRVAREEGLALAINGVLFNASMKNVLPGSHVKAIETLIVDHKVNHEYGPQSLIWFDESLSPRLELGRPPSKEVMAKARWAIGSQLVIYRNRAVSQYAGNNPDARTLVGIDEGQKLLYFGVFENASAIAATQMLADFGAREIVPMDGGSSTMLTFGPGAKGVSSGAAVYPLRSLPIFVGVRAKPLQ